MGLFFRPNSPKSVYPYLTPQWILGQYDTPPLTQSQYSLSYHHHSCKIVIFTGMAQDVLSIYA